MFENSAPSGSVSPSYAMGSTGAPGTNLIGGSPSSNPPPPSSPSGCPTCQQQASNVTVTEKLRGMDAAPLDLWGQDTYSNGAWTEWSAPGVGVTHLPDGYFD